MPGSSTALTVAPQISRDHCASPFHPVPAGVICTAQRPAGDPRGSDHVRGTLGLGHGPEPLHRCPTGTTGRCTPNGHRAETFCRGVARRLTRPIRRPLREDLGPGRGRGRGRPLRRRTSAAVEASVEPFRRSEGGAARVTDPAVGAATGVGVEDDQNTSRDLREIGQQGRPTSTRNGAPVESRARPNSTSAASGVGALARTFPVRCPTTARRVGVRSRYRCRRANAPARVSEGGHTTYAHESGPDAHASVAGAAPLAGGGRLGCTRADGLRPAREQLHRPAAGAPRARVLPAMTSISGGRRARRAAAEQGQGASRQSCCSEVNTRGCDGEVALPGVHPGAAGQAAGAQRPSVPGYRAVRPSACGRGDSAATAAVTGRFCVTRR